MIIMNREQFKIKLHSCLAEYDGQQPSPISDDINSDNCHRVLTRLDTVSAGILVAGYFGVSGSTGNIDVYNLLNAYYLDPVKRNEINEIIGVKTKPQWYWM